MTQVVISCGPITHCGQTSFTTMGVESSNTGPGDTVCPQLLLVIAIQPRWMQTIKLNSEKPQTLWDILTQQYNKNCENIWPSNPHKR